jgi:hypothetical protein
MKPPLPRTAQAVPRLPHVQLEIAKAIRTLIQPNENEFFRRKRAEIAALRGDLEQFRFEIRKAFDAAAVLAEAELRAALAIKYNPDQPRVPAGNRDGGQWTSGNDGDGGASRALPTSPPATPQVRYAALDTGTQSDGIESAPTSQLITADAGSGAATNKISAHDIPADSPKHPVQLLDSSGQPIVDAQGKPLLRPDDKPPEMFVHEGLATKDMFDHMMLRGDVRRAWDMFYARASQFAHGGPWDAQRIDGQFVEEYRDYATIAIGLYMAAAGVPLAIALAIEAGYAYDRSKFDRNEPMDWIYRDLPVRNVRNTEIGYELYRSGRVTAGH